MKVLDHPTLSERDPTRPKDELTTLRERVRELERRLAHFRHYLDTTRDQLEAERDAVLAKLALEQAAHAAARAHIARLEERLDATVHRIAQALRERAGRLPLFELARRVARRLGAKE